MPEKQVPPCFMDEKTPPNQLVIYNNIRKNLTVRCVLLNFSLDYTSFMRKF